MCLEKLGDIMSTEVVVARRNNNFDALRIAAAIAVIFGHACVLLGHPESTPVVFGLPVEQLGVAVFFVISGYLIVGSWQRTRSLPQYFTSRILRIVPGLIAVTVLAAFVVGPLVTVLDPSAYFSSSATYSYLRNALLVPNYRLPGVFADNPYPVAVNGSLWTLPAEFACYLLVPVIGWLRGRLQVVGWALFAIASALVTIAFHFEFFGARVESAALMWVFFAGGAIARLTLDRERFRLDIASIIIIIWMTVVGFFPQYGVYASWLALPYCVLAIGVQSTPVVHRASRFGDLSYGLYLWAFPVQQAVVHFLGVIPLAVDLAIVIPITAALAFASWHLVEHPSMELAGRLPWSRPANAAGLPVTLASPSS